jgi:hypothetical protein
MSWFYIQSQGDLFDLMEEEETDSEEELELEEMAEEAMPQGQVSGTKGDDRGGHATRPGEWN